MLSPSVPPLAKQCCGSNFSMVCSEFCLIGVWVWQRSGPGIGSGLPAKQATAARTVFDWWAQDDANPSGILHRIGVPTGSRLAFPAFPAKFCSLPGGHREPFRTLFVTAPDAVPALSSCDTSSMPPDSGTYNRQCGHDLRNVVAVRGFFTGSSCSDNFPENHQSRDSGQHCA